jgi:hypothetical protein
MKIFDAGENVSTHYYQETAPTLTPHYIRSFRQKLYTAPLIKVVIAYGGSPLVCF